jgi:hypothetical protein
MHFPLKSGRGGYASPDDLRQISTFLYLLYSASNPNQGRRHPNHPVKLPLSTPYEVISLTSWQVMPC